MTQEQLHGNRVIAKYCGAKEYWLNENIFTFPMFDNPEQSKNKATTHRAEELKYHSSFDWLNPIAKKVRDELNKFYGTSHPGRSCALIFNNALYGAIQSLDIDELFTAVVKAIEFLNTIEK